MKKIILLIVTNFLFFCQFVAFAKDYKADMKIFHNNGYLIGQSGDEKFKYWLDGRIYLDGAFFHKDNNDQYNKVGVSKARFTIKTKVHENFYGEFDVDLVDNEVKICDLWIGYTGLNLPFNNILKIGHHKEPFSMEELTSSRNITFIKRSLPNLFVPGRHMGMSLTSWKNNWRISCGIYGQEIENNEDGDRQGSEGYGYSARLNFLPILKEDKLIHLGINGGYRVPDAKQEDDDEKDLIRFKSNSEINFISTRLLDTNDISHVRDTRMFGFELAGSYGPLSFQSEYIGCKVLRYYNRKNLYFSGWYAYFSFMLTGITKPYNMFEAEFGQLIPKNKKGELEIALRYSTLDLTDENVKSGNAENITLGLNYYVNTNFKAMINLIHAMHDEHATGKKNNQKGDDDLFITAFRLQYVF